MIQVAIDQRSGTELIYGLISLIFLPKHKSSNVFYQLLCGLLKSFVSQTVMIYIFIDVRVSMLYNYIMKMWTWSPSTVQFSTGSG